MRLISRSTDSLDAHARSRSGAVLYGILLVPVASLYAVAGVHDPLRVECEGGVNGKTRSVEDETKNSCGLPQHLLLKVAHLLLLFSHFLLQIEFRGLLLQRNETRNM